MIFGFAIPLAIVAVIIFAVRSQRNGRSTLTTSQQVRYFFLYALLLAAALVTASGASGALGSLLDRSALVAADASQTALNLSMLLIGAPLTGVLVALTRRRLAHDRLEQRSFGWALFFTTATVASLVVATFGIYRVLLAMMQVERFDGYALSQGVVWLGAWYVVRRVDRRTTNDVAQLRHVILALIGLIVSAVAITQLIAAAVDPLVDRSTTELFVSSMSATERGLALLVIGALLWTLYWLRSVATAPQSEGWRFIVVLFGIGGGLITALSAAAVACYQVAVWLVGSPQSSVAREHFGSFPEALGALGAGMLVWWYHRSVLAARRSSVRYEIDRVYEYVMAGGGLLASAVGLVFILVGVLDSFTGSRLLRGDTATNSLLLSLILIALGWPVWYGYWRGITARYRNDKPDERTSPSRRIYLLLLLGVGGLVALASAIAVVYIFLRDVIEGRVSSATVRDLRYSLAILIVASLVAWYHLSPYRQLHVATTTAPRRRVVIAGPPDERVSTFMNGLPNLDVEWIPTTTGAWVYDEVFAHLASSNGDVMIVVTPSAVRIADI